DEMNVAEYLADWRRFTGLPAREKIPESGISVTAAPSKIPDSGMTAGATAAKSDSRIGNSVTESPPAQGESQIPESGIPESGKSTIVKRSASNALEEVSSVGVQTTFKAVHAETVAVEQIPESGIAIGEAAALIEDDAVRVRAQERLRRMWKLFALHGEDAARRELDPEGMWGKLWRKRAYHDPRCDRILNCAEDDVKRLGVGPKGVRNVVKHVMYLFKTFA
ncbi:MAG: hypothetical protein AB1705_25155, partial [Verrucomicrobiota bacterium]